MHLGVRTTADEQGYLDPLGLLPAAARRRSPLRRRPRRRRRLRRRSPARPRRSAAGAAAPRRAGRAARREPPPARGCSRRLVARPPTLRRLRARIADRCDRRTGGVRRAARPPPRLSAARSRPLPVAAPPAAPVRSARAACGQAIRRCRGGARTRRSARVRRTSASWLERVSASPRRASRTPAPVRAPAVPRSTGWARRIDEVAHRAATTLRRGRTALPALVAPVQSAGARALPRSSPAARRAPPARCVHYAPRRSSACALRRRPRRGRRGRRSYHP